MVCANALGKGRLQNAQVTERRALWLGKGGNVR